MPEPRLTKRARADLEALPAAVQLAVAEMVAAIGSDPEAVGKPLLGRLRGLWSARVGNYRVLYTVERSRGHRRVVIRSIRHRAVAYRRRR